MVLLGSTIVKELYSFCLQLSFCYMDLLSPLPIITYLFSVLQALMGHSEIETTLKFYADVERGHLKRWAAEMSDALSGSTENLLTSGTARHGALLANSHKG